MSGFVRTIQRTLIRKLKHRRGRHFMGRGSKLGVSNPKDASKLARERREQRRKPA